MLTKKIYLTIIVYLVLYNTVVAQLDIRLTSSFGSISLLPESSLNIHAKPESFLTAGLQADYFLSKNFGVGAGADYFVKDCKFDVKLSDYSHSYNGIDKWEADPVPRQYEFTIKSNSPDITEQNTFSFIEIPVSAFYSFPLSGNTYIVTRLGVKAGFPLKKSYLLSESDLLTRLYFKEWDLELFNIPAHGLYDSRTDWHPEGELNLNTAFSVFSEVGIDFPISLLKVRLSGYFSYGLNNLNYEKQSSLIYWREDYNYILSLAESAKMMQVGVKLGVGIITYKENRTRFKTSRKQCPAYL
jgi:OmpA-OmpF porin, OOP family